MFSFVLKSWDHHQSSFIRDTSSTFVKYIDPDNAETATAECSFARETNEMQIFADAKSSDRDVEYVELPLASEPKQPMIVQT